MVRGRCAARAAAAALRGAVRQPGSRVWRCPPCRPRRCVAGPRLQCGCAGALSSRVRAGERSEGEEDVLQEVQDARGAHGDAVQDRQGVALRAGGAPAPQPRSGGWRRSGGAGGAAPAPLRRIAAKP